MNISSSSSANLLADLGPIGAGARQEYAVAVAKKIQDNVKQEGVAITQLIDSAPVPPQSSGSVGTRLSAVV